MHGPTGRRLKVIFGGGRQKFIDRNEKDDQGYHGERTDKRNLILEWLNEKNENENRAYVWNKVIIVII